MIEKKGASAPIYTTQGGHAMPKDKNILSKLIEGVMTVSRTANWG
jgi:hypothetical protein